ncbi:MAG: metallophosphoesterase [Candidatus Thorarchaeota archaeon]
MSNIVAPIHAKAFILNPNLGHPLFLSVDKGLKTKKLEVKVLCASNVIDELEIEKIFKDNIEFIPLFEYKWKLRQLIEEEKRKQEKRIKELIKEKHIWQRIILKISKKRRTSFEEKIGAEFKKKIESYEEELKGGMESAKRGDPIEPIIKKIKPALISGIDKPDFNSYQSVVDYFKKQEILDDFKHFHTIHLEFTINESIEEYLKAYNFIMFDILQKLENITNRINYHSIVISKSDWNTYSFVHATDLHVAERNDSIYEIVKNWLKTFKLQSLENQKDEGFFTKLSKFFQRIPEKLEETQKTLKPLKKRFVNPNNNFRTFIKLINKEVLNNKIEFVVLTGDLIDFAILSTISKDTRKTSEFNYNITNWRVFKNIVLNHDAPDKRGVIRGEELMCPIFTIPGNHDYRPYHYDLRWGGLYKKIGLNANEALALNDKYLANPITAITKSFRALKGYIFEVNPSLDYFFKLGHNNFIFLNSGSDSFKNLRDLISGKPSVTGLSTKQISFLKQLKNTHLNSEEHNFLFLHGPPINPKKSISLLKRVGKMISNDKFLTEISQFKESLFQKLGMTKSKARIDEDFNLQFGTISSHWEELIDFCKNNVILTLSGHTHELKEFRLGSVGRNGKENPESKAENHPIPIYYDLYSEIYTNSKDIENNGPFIVQTPALGLGGYHNPKLMGGFREIHVKDGKLDSFKVKFINR